MLHILRMPRQHPRKIQKNSLRYPSAKASLPAVKVSRKQSLRRPVRPAPRAARPAVVSAWSMVVIDNQPIRRKAQRDYQKAVRDLDAAKAESERFHNEDKPLFSRWLSSNFGSLLTEIRDLQSKLFEVQNLINEVQQEYYYGRHDSIASAYRAVLHRREHPEPEPQSSEPDDFDQAEARAAEEFAEEFWQRFQNGKANRNTAPNPLRRAHDGRLKDLYRKLARRLHPDNGRVITPREAELWHKTQAAYEAGQVDVLESILTLLEVGDKGAKNAPVSTLFQLTAALKKTLRTLKRQLTELRQDAAWNFSQRHDRNALHRVTEEMLHADRDKLLWLLTRYESQLHRWALQSPAQRTPQRKRVRSARTNWADEEWF